MNSRASAGLGDSGVTVWDADLDPNAVGVASYDAGWEGAFVAVAYGEPVAGLWVEGIVVGSWAVAYPGLDNKVRSDAGSVEPEVVHRVHVLIVPARSLRSRRGCQSVRETGT